jgi:hypothetical protein
MAVNKDYMRKHLDTFGEKVVNSAKKNLIRFNKGGSNLEKTLDWETEVSKNSWLFNINYETSGGKDYWEFVDAGVKGIGGTKADGSKWKLKRVTNNKFKYKDKMPPPSAFSRWSIKKGLAPRSKGGQFTKRKGLQFALAKSVWHTGIETTEFLTKPFAKYFKKLPDDIVEAFNLQMDDMLRFSLNNDKNG